MATINLKKETTTFKTYYLIKNNDNSEEVYFAFEWTVKEGWNELVNNWENLKEVELEFEEKSLP